ncbi:MAG: hypothetical protein HFF60_12810 [Oscillospiraceae bacterium]|jgi:hypothetical protein|nr:hypothetical protein [Oscillospiraceae bacterium]
MVQRSNIEIRAYAATQRPSKGDSSAKIVSGTNEVNSQITYFNPDGKAIFAQGKLVSPLTAIHMPAASEQLIFEGMTDCGKTIPVTESIDLSDFSEYDKNSYLYEHGYISEEEKIENQGRQN